mmetsp:Transcript_56352/g.164733  ORF Transcript_56352/g.164733 Transcript_56352/m.164733 type:complete len:202 (+) Transcript_56352:1001-1606(+)
MRRSPSFSHSMPPVMALKSDSNADGNVPNHCCKSSRRLSSCSWFLITSMDAIMNTKPSITRKTPNSMKSQKRADILPMISFNITVSLANRLKSRTTRSTRSRRTVRRKETSKPPPDSAEAAALCSEKDWTRSAKVAAWSWTCKTTRIVSKAFQYLSLPLQNRVRSAAMRRQSSDTKSTQKTESSSWMGRGGTSSSRWSAAY